MAIDLVFTPRIDAGRLTLELNTANLDAVTVPRFKEAVSELDLTSVQTVSVNLQKVEFIDSSGIGALIYLNNQIPENKRPLQLFNVSPHVISLLELLRVHRLLDIHPAG